MTIAVFSTFLVFNSVIPESASFPALSTVSPFLLTRALETTTSPSTPPPPHPPPPPPPPPPSPPPPPPPQVEHRVFFHLLSSPGFSFQRLPPLHGNLCETRVLHLPPDLHTIWRSDCNGRTGPKRTPHARGRLGRAGRKKLMGKC